MHIVSTTLVRVVSAVALVALLLGVVAPLLGVIPFESDVANARAWNYYGSPLPNWAVNVWMVTSIVTLTTGLIGMTCLWAPARWFLVGYLAATLVIQPFVGLAVFSPYEASFAGIIGASILWLVTISFWSPFADRLRNGVRTNAT